MFENNYNFTLMKFPYLELWISLSAGMMVYIKESHAKVKVTDYEFSYKYKDVCLLASMN